MKRQSKNFMWGILFIFAAIYVLLQQLNILGDIKLLSVLATIILVPIMIRNLRVRQFGGVFFPLYLLFIIYAKQFSFWPFRGFSVWGLFLAASFATIGFSILFPQKKNGHKSVLFSSSNLSQEAYDPVNYEQIVDVPDEQIVNYNVSFGSSIKYVNSNELQRANLNCSFGALKVYFDKATPTPAGAQIHITSSFGEVRLYLPKAWQVINQLEATMGRINDEEYIQNPDGIPVILSGNAFLGAITIIYI